MPTPFSRFDNDPSPVNAVEYAIESHTRTAIRGGGPFNHKYVETLREVKRIIEANAAGNAKTGGRP